MTSFRARISQSTRRGFIATLLAAAAVVLGTAASRAEDTIRLRLDWLPTAYHAPLFYGAKQGFYRAEGINLAIEDGKGTTVALQAVAAGNDEVVLASYTAMIQSSAAGMDLVGIGGLIQRSPSAIVSLQSDPIRTPADLVGKAVATSPSSEDAKLLVAFLKAAGIDASKVKVINTAPGLMGAAVLSGTAQAETEWSFSGALVLNQQKPIAKPMLYSDYGINVLGLGFVTTKAYAAKNGDLLHRFMKATAKSYQDGLKNPKSTIAALVADRPDTAGKAALMEEQIALFPQFLHTKRTESLPFGWTAREDWDQTEQLLHDYFDMTAKVDVASLYTNDFLESGK